MKILLLSILVLINYQQFGNCKLFPIEEKYPLLGDPSPPGSPWPFPQYMGGSSKKLVFLDRGNFKFETNMLVDCDLVEENILHYRHILFPRRIVTDESKPDTVNTTVLSAVGVNITLNGVCPGYPNADIDESYEIQVNGSYANITAHSVWGALRGLETFAQLVFLTDDNKLALNDSTVVKDFPRFKYRGLLLDTARHFIPVPILLKQLDIMAYNKLNVFHWHIVDDQSFPFESVKFPKLTENGRYTKYHVYTQKDMVNVVEHARLRGIRVIPEFDSPGHVASLGKTFPELLTVCWNNGKPYQSIYSVQAKTEILNPTLESVYPVVKEILAEFKLVFPDEYIHLGNDEVYYECWKSNPNITEWMAEHNFTSYHQLEAYYTNRLLTLARDLNKRVTVWQDVYDNGVELDPSTYIQIWKDTSILPNHETWQTYLNRVTQSGHVAILSSPWYLNFISYGYQDWYKLYQIEPLANFTGGVNQRKLFLGGEACLWGEYVDGTNIESRLWPRASAVAERLWSPANINNVEDAKFRLDEHRCRLLRRGVKAQPVLNGYCGGYEYGMDNSVFMDNEFNYFVKSRSKDMSLSNSVQFTPSIVSLLVFIVIALKIQNF